MGTDVKIVLVVAALAALEETAEAVTTKESPFSLRSRVPGPGMGV
jgi:hypothetical protein